MTANLFLKAISSRSSPSDSSEWLAFISPYNIILESTIGVTGKKEMIFN